jgi:hypothetical protein
VVDLVNGPADALFQSAVVDRLAVAVIEPFPFRIDLAPPAAPLAQDGTLDLELTLTRDKGFDGGVEVILPFLPPWVDGPSAVTIPPGQTKAVYQLRAFPRAAPREWSICAEAEAGGGSGRRTDVEVTPGASDPLPTAPPPEIAVASQLVKLSVLPSPIAGKLEDATTEQGAPLTMSASLHVRGEIPTDMMAELEGLPNRVTSSAVPVRAGQPDVQFQVQLAPDAPVGVFPDLVVRLSGSLHGQKVSICVGRGGVLRITPRGALVRDENGRPLSRLQVLQRAESGRGSGGR